MDYKIKYVVTGDMVVVADNDEDLKEKFAKWVKNFSTPNSKQLCRIIKHEKI